MAVSKASEWAKAAYAISNAEVRGLTIPGVYDSPHAAGDEQKPFNVHASVGHRCGEPTMCVTDRRLGGLTLTAAQALTLARWILATFGDEP